MKRIMLMAALAMGICFASCTKEDVYSDKPITNVELKALLEKQGVTFNETGCIRVDEVSNGITSLDLSGIKMENLAELEALANLTDVKLGGFGPVFDFTTLPAQITSLDLTKNEIYDFEGLVKDEAVVRDFKSLFVPATMKDNFDDMIPYYLKNKEAIANGTVVLKMADEKGNLNAYTTLRAIPDANLVKYLEQEFTSVMKDGKIDMAAGLVLEEATKAIEVMSVGSGATFEVDVENFEGIQYLINNPTWKGASIYLYGVNGKSVMPTIPVKECVTDVDIQSVDGDIDFSKAAGLIKVMVGFNNTIKELNLTGATLWGTRDSEFDMYTGSGIMIHDLPALEKIVLPKGKDLKCSMFLIEVISSLKELDLSNIGAISNFFSLAEFADGCKITYPNLTMVKEDGSVTTAFACSSNVWALQSTKDFLDKYYTKAKVEDRITAGFLMNSMDEFYWQDVLGY